MFRGILMFLGSLIIDCRHEFIGLIFLFLGLLKFRLISII